MNNTANQFNPFAMAPACWKMRLHRAGVSVKLVVLTAVLCMSLSGILPIMATHHNGHTNGSDLISGASDTWDDNIYLQNAAYDDVSTTRLLRQKPSDKSMGSTQTFKINNSNIPLTANDHENNQHHQNRRNLSTFDLVENECKINKPKQKNLDKINIIYFASYPGSGSTIVRNLISGLSGVHLGQIAIQTHYPHKSGMLVDGNDSGGTEDTDINIQKALVLIRNPMNAISSLFNHMYEMKKHLPLKFQEGYQQRYQDTNDQHRTPSVEEWASWRDRVWATQMVAYRDFIRYWTSRYHGGDRLIVSFENLTDNHVGGEEARRLNHFLSKVEGLETIDAEAVPCVWKAVVKTTMEHGGDVSFVGDGNYDGEKLPEEAILEAELSGRRRKRRLNEEESHERGSWGHRRLGYYIPHPGQHRNSSGSKEERPYTPHQLNDMAIMLQDLAGEFQEHSILQELLTRYHREVMEVALSNGQFPSQQEQQLLPQSYVQMQEENQLTYAGTTVDGRKFHIFQASPDNTPESVVATNWLMGLFESSSDVDYTYLVSSPGLYVYQRGNTVPVSTTVVTKTQITDLIALYKMFKPEYDEVFFVATHGGTDPSKRIDEETCEYDNVLCIDNSKFTYSSDEDLPQMEGQLTQELKQRFSYFFGLEATNAKLNENQAILRLKRTGATFLALENEPSKMLDMKYGVRGGHRNMDDNNQGDKANGLVQAQSIANNLPRRLFYCGHSGPKDKPRNSIYGIFLVNSFFPEILGGAPDNTQGREVAIRLTDDTMKDANPNDFLVYHMHQICDAEVLRFPGLQLHVNAEYYDIHPRNYLQNENGQYTLNYIPPGDNIYVIGPHQDGPRSIRLPYAMMRWWVSVKGSRAFANQETMDLFFDHSKKPKNSGKHFLLYANSHYVYYREAAAHSLAAIKPIHAIGICQGNTAAGPKEDGLKSPQCQPYKENEIPSSVIVHTESGRNDRSFNSVIGHDFRFVLLMENVKSDGYITEKIVDGFMSGSIPIYYGTTEVFDIFNRNAFIYFDIENPYQALDRIEHLENDPQEYERMLNEPILADGVNTIEKYFSFEDSIGHGMLKKRVREKLGFPV